MRQSLRVLHVIRSDAFAGVERHVANLAAAQHDLGHRVRVIGGSPDHMQAVFGSRAIPVLAAPTTMSILRILGRTSDPDVVHAHMSAAEFAVTLAPHLRTVPLVATRHFARRRGSSTLARQLGMQVARRIAAQIAISHYVADRIEGPSTVVHSGVPDRPDAGPYLNREKVALVVQRLEPEKRTEVALGVFAASGLAEDGWLLEVAGDGSERGRLELLASDLGIWQATRFLGSRSDCLELMDQARAIIAPCDIDGLGLSVVEAMSGGLPVIAAAAGGHRETVGRADDARLFTPGDASAGGDLLVALARDPGRAGRYGDELQTVQREKFSLTAQAQATIQVYREVLR
ncbi:Glycosyltransferase involved in cell wall bisynthesis [Sanguibacter gelidistatuariae]|uniref:Glycosyltransferase involved in cell wall bisynthesis n=1 Tax=Sanguibacter gelidistatuariae TaxID=1814289 RepID=A0A1G6QCS9_9MICO|nr:glycosyltransferase family 4 protein [Sanguibacter gelidistatuariae]SDC89475.1 Glycosyltransferase involved in cell wall bisynthesis [Sanguibacter gelidistatuariae]